MDDILNILLEEKIIKEILQESEEAYYFSQLINKSSDSKNLSERIRICHLIISYIFQEAQDEKIKTSLVEKAYILLKTIDIQNETDKSVLEKTIGVEDLRTESLYFFY